MKAWIGCDPGKTGAISVLTYAGESASYRVPLIGKEYDINEILLMFNNFTEMYDIHVVIEKVHAMSGIAASSNWSLAESVMMYKMVMITQGIPFTMVPSKTWQKEMWAGVPIQRVKTTKNKSGYKTDTKATSLLAVRRLFPDADLLGVNAGPRVVEPHDGIVDALLMAGYAKRKGY